MRVGSRPKLAASAASSRASGLSGHGLGGVSRNDVSDEDAGTTAPVSACDVAAAAVLRMGRRGDDLGRGGLARAALYPQVPSPARARPAARLWESPIILGRAQAGARSEHARRYGLAAAVGAVFCSPRVPACAPRAPGSAPRPRGRQACSGGLHRGRRVHQASRAPRPTERGPARPARMGAQRQPSAPSWQGRPRCVAAALGACVRPRNGCLQKCVRPPQRRVRRVTTSGACLGVHGLERSGVHRGRGAGAAGACPGTKVAGPAQRWTTGPAGCDERGGVPVGGCVNVSGRGAERRSLSYQNLRREPHVEVSS